MEDGILAFMSFYFAFVVLIVLIFSFIPLEIITGISKEHLDDIIITVSVPEEPTIIDYVLYPFAVAFSFLANLFVLNQMSSVYQVVSAILSILSFAFILCVYSLLRNG